MCDAPRSSAASAVSSTRRGARAVWSAGLYGLELGGLLGGITLSTERDASKVALTHLVALA